MAGYCYKTSGIPGTNPTIWSGGGISISGKGITDTAVASPQFPMNPGYVNNNIFIYYTSGTGIKLFNSATEKLPETFYKE